MSGIEQYRDYCRPKLAELLQSLRLDKEYVHAEGSYLQTASGQRVLDLVGGFGTALLGHNHPELVTEAVTALQKGVAINAQGSVRSDSATLARRLGELTGASQGYCVNFSNSGAESVEAALKHAYKVRFDAVRREYERLTRILNDLYYRIEREDLQVELPGDNQDLIDFRDDLDEYNLAQFEAFQNNPVVLAFKGAFHGKTSAALKVTFNKSYREAFEGLSAIRPVYVDMHQPERLEQAIDEEVSTFYYPVLVDQRVELRALSMTRVIVAMVEVVLGEGGIKPMPEPTLSMLASLQQHRKLPLLIDEIQTGCGRLGTVYGYHDTPLKAIEPDYIVLSKALGGGIAKIGASLIRRDIYDQDFGILHTSTFAEDDLSARIASKALDILTRNDAAMLKKIRTDSNYLLTRLGELQDKYPALIKDVRGKGLMLGVELSPLLDRSPFFRASGRQGVLSLLVASYLLEYHNIRILAPLTTMLKGNPGKLRLSILRIQPPATVSIQELDRLIHALDEVLNIIECNNEYCLVSHLIGEPLSSDQRRKPVRMKVRWPVQDEQRHIDSRIAFIVHPTTIETLSEYYFPSFEAYQSDAGSLKRWWNLISRFLEPVHVKSSYVSSNDYVIENNLVFVPYLPEKMAARKALYIEREIQDKVQDAVTLARELGDDNIPVSIVGLGAYTSIATQNGQTLNDYEVPVTTGNAYTTALTIQGIMHAAELKGLDLRTASVAVVGATGNIGMVTSQVLSLNVGQLSLVGRQGERGLARLSYVRQQCLHEIIEAIRRERALGRESEHTELSGVGGQIQHMLRVALSEPGDPLHGLAQELSGETLGQDYTRRLQQVIDNTVLDALLPLHTGLDNLKHFDVVVLATNSSDRELIQPQHLKQDAIVCCTSVPSNLSRQFSASGKQVAFDGGLAQLPEQSKINFVGMPGGDLAYGCMAETLLMGFDGQNHSFCKGTLTTAQVYRTVELAELHDFGLGELRLDDQTLRQLSETA